MKRAACFAVLALVFTFAVRSQSIQTDGDIEADGQLVSNVTTGTAPLTVASSTKVTNLNADQLDGLDAAGFSLAADTYSKSEVDALIAAVLASSRKSFYLAKADVGAGEWDGDAADEACAAGFHMASVWEILDPSNLTYDAGHADATTTDDSGQGPPTGKLGWVRTGNVSADSGVWGEANCSNWGTASGTSYGTSVLLPGSWVYSNDDLGTIEPWDMSLEDCSQPQGVWCVED